MLYEISPHTLGTALARTQALRARKGAERTRTAVSCLTPDPYELVFAWGNNPRRAELKDRLCRVIARGSRMRSVLVEFENGERVVTSMRAIRRS